MSAEQLVASTAPLFSAESIIIKKFLLISGFLSFKALIFGTMTLQFNYVGIDVLSGKLMLSN